MFFTAFTIGLLGSLHCVGMCGPIALSLPKGQNNTFERLQNVLLYNLGRILTYAFLGIFIGLISQGLFLAHIQKGFSIGLGVFLLIVAIFSINIESHLLKNGWISRFYLYLKVQLNRLLGTNHTLAHFKIGVLNGFLPCGLVYVAIVGALAVEGWIGSIIYMLLFGLGTVPLMLATALAGKIISVNFRNMLKKAYPVFITGFAVLLIFRGLNLEIPATMDILISMKNEILCH